MVLQPIVLPVSVDQQNVLLLVRIAMQMVIYAVILLLQCAAKKMVLQPTMQTVNADQLNVIQMKEDFARRLLICVLKLHLVLQ